MDRSFTGACGRQSGEVPRSPDLGPQFWQNLGWKNRGGLTASGPMVRCLKAEGPPVWLWWDCQGCHRQEQSYSKVRILRKWLESPPIWTAPGQVTELNWIEEGHSVQAKLLLQRRAHFQDIQNWLEALPCFSCTFLVLFSQRWRGGGRCPPWPWSCFPRVDILGQILSPPSYTTIFVPHPWKGMRRTRDKWLGPEIWICIYSNCSIFFRRLAT